ncbi:FmdB family zinc ribbon protein [Blastococcus sp. SYSU DS0552]
MPTYQYACTNAEGKHEFEVVQSFTDAPVSECPECGAAVRKVYGSVGVVFKGSGFYRTDSRSNGKSSESTGSNGTSTDTSSSTPAKESSSSSASTSSTTPSTSGSGAKAATT